jgi:hypothetical protein
LVAATAAIAGLYDYWQGGLLGEQRLLFGGLLLQLVLMHGTGPHEGRAKRLCREDAPVARIVAHL